MAGLRLVLDTQVWLDWLVFEDASVTRLREAQAAGRVELVIDEPCEAELARVLGYDLGRFSLPPAAREACLARCRELALRVASAPADALPACRDPDDQKFLELAAAARAHALLTKDRALLELARRPLPFVICPPQALEIP